MKMIFIEEIHNLILHNIPFLYPDEMVHWLSVGHNTYNIKFYGNALSILIKLFFVMLYVLANNLSHVVKVLSGLNQY